MFEQQKITFFAPLDHIALERILQRERGGVINSTETANF
jgi:hypothetical protein